VAAEQPGFNAPSVTVNDAPVGAVTDSLAGCVAIAGSIVHGVITVNVATFDVVDECALVRMTRYCVPFRPVELAMFTDPDVAPLTFENVLEPLGADCHWIVAGEQPGGTGPSDTVNVAAAGAVTVALAG